MQTKSSFLLKKMPNKKQLVQKLRVQMRLPLQVRQNKVQLQLLQMNKWRSLKLTQVVKQMGRRKPMKKKIAVGQIYSLQRS